ncbi:hypothetical protein C7Y66_12860 [Chroococcidiopsis sp. CCALA 051]|jgi:hypothetical protein|uniref:hypothetical protein n=1 Tax=Chroococcidiopsis sp. CCALA 051 TaxID=869949 RepID=UPI000D0CBC41|nr:hypothetical protein [Chroococcidiopsis sp. CCALA 051]PSM48724.1 hypothetical protein C7Y66_12860 [Chroococcidiopsis sp. CCALA 051]
MKNLIKLVFLGSFAFLALRAFGNPLLALSNSFGNQDQYQVKWEGSNGAELYGGYVIMDMNNHNTPMRAESVKAKLPHTVNFSAPKNAIVSATGNTIGSSSVIVRIYKNGLECGKEAIVGSGALPNKVCQ